MVSTTKKRTQTRRIRNPRPRSPRASRDSIKFQGRWYAPPMRPRRPGEDVAGDTLAIELAVDSIRHNLAEHARALAGRRGYYTARQHLRFAEHAAERACFHIQWNPEGIVLDLGHGAVRGPCRLRFAHVAKAVACVYLRIGGGWLCDAEGLCRQALRHLRERPDLYPRCDDPAWGVADILAEVYRRTGRADLAERLAVAGTFTERRDRAPDWVIGMMPAVKPGPLAPPAPDWVNPYRYEHRPDPLAARTNALREIVGKRIAAALRIGGEEGAALLRLALDGLVVLHDSGVIGTDTRWTIFAGLLRAASRVAKTREGGAR